MLDAFYFIYSFMRGAVAVGVISCSDTPCWKVADLKRLHEEIEVSSALLKELGIAGDRLFIVNSDSHTHLEEAFHSAERRSAQLQKPDLLCEGTKKLGEGEHSLPMLLQNVAAREVFVEGLPGIPSGMIKMADQHACTLCGVCREYCPGNALRIEENGAGKALRFSHAHCIACARQAWRIGRGLGLYSCRLVVEGHHGSILAANRDNGGARFQVELPAGKSSHVHHLAHC